MPSAHHVAQSLLPPELRLLGSRARKGSGQMELFCEKTSKMEVCPKCATPSTSTYDRRSIRVRDDNLRAKRLWLIIRKRRFWCKPCRLPFTEPVPGIKKGARVTERLRKSILWAAERFVNIKAIRDSYRVSASLVYKTIYTELERRRKTRLYPWPAHIGIDEHFFRRHKKGFRSFVTMVVDDKNKKLFELVDGKRSLDLELALRHIPGRDNVKTVTCDLADPYKNFAERFFPNAQIIADKFHVLRLLHPAINRHRKLITGDKRNLPARKLLLKNGKDLDGFTQRAIYRWLDKYPTLRAIYGAKEWMHHFYRIRGYRRAKKALIKFCDELATTAVSELKTLRKTLLGWHRQILAYFRHRRTNARTEGFNNKAKLVKRRGYGYKSFENYRLQLLNACAQK